MMAAEARVTRVTAVNVNPYPRVSMRAPTTDVDTARTMLPNMVTNPKPMDFNSDGSDEAVEE